MSKKFETDEDPDRLADMAEDAARTRNIKKEHEAGPGTIEPRCYEPDKNGVCQCEYCKNERNK